MWLTSLKAFLAIFAIGAFAYFYTRDVSLGVRSVIFMGVLGAGQGIYYYGRAGGVKLVAQFLLRYGVVSAVLCLICYLAIRFLA